MEGEEPTQATQNVLDPRRVGKQNSGFSDEDVSDIICILYPHSDSARQEVQNLAQQHCPYILGRTQADDVETDYDLEDDASRFESNPNGHGNYTIILRLSSQVKNPAAGFAFGRNPSRCDVVFVNDPLRRVSNIHFRIYVNDFGNVMIEDQSTNGTFVDGKLLSRPGRGGDPASASQSQNPSPRWVLSSGTVINIFLHDKVRDLTFRVRIPRRDEHYEQAYKDNVAEYFARHGLPMEGAVANPAPTAGVDLFRTAGKPLPRAGGQRQEARTQMAAPTTKPRQSRNTEWRGSGKYNKVRQIGKGAFAVVYMVTSKYDGRPYAAKELEKRHFIKNGVLDQKVENEMRIMQQLDHPNIVRYIENFDYNERLFIIIMEYVANGDLGRLVSENRPLTEQVVQDMAVQLISALRYLHINNITHRDVKPDNILINSLDPLVVKLTDFGLSKMVDSEQTFLRTFCGTLLYCAPEVYTEYVEYDEDGIRARGRQMRRGPGQRYSHAVDIWSLGGVLFYALTGSPPYPTRSVTSPTELLHKVMTTNLNVTPLHQYGTSAAGVDFICHMLQRRPEQRATIEDLEHHAWLEDFVETIQASQSYDQVTDDEEFSGQPRYDPYGEDEYVGDSMNDDSDQENRTVVPSNQGPRLFGEVGVSAIGSSGAIPEEMLNLSPGNRDPNATEIDSNIDEAYDSGESVSDRSDQENLHGQAGASIFPNQSTDQLQSLVEEVASQSLGGNGKKNNSDLSPRRSVHSIDPNTSKRKPASVETSDEFDENTPPGKPTIKRLKSDGHVDDLIPEAMIEEYRLLASVPQIKTLGLGRQEDAPVIKSVWWRQDLDTWHLDYPEMTELQYDMFKDATRQRNEDFRPGGTPLWRLAMKYFPPATKGSMRNGRSPTLSTHDSVVRASDFPPTGNDAENELQDAQIDSQRVVPIQTAGTAVGMIESDPGSCIPGVAFPITDSFTSFGRGPENTWTYEPKSDTRVPKYAFKILLHPDGSDASRSGPPWTDDSGSVDPDEYSFWISTKATNGIRVNGKLLRSSNPKSPQEASENWGRLYHGDVVTIWQNSTTDTPPQTKLVFHCFWGASSKHREAEGLELAPPPFAHKLDSACKRAELKVASRRKKAEAKTELQLRAQNVQEEVQRNAVFEEKRQEAIRFLSSRQPLMSRRLSPAGAPGTTNTTYTTTRMSTLHS